MAADVDHPGHVERDPARDRQRAAVAERVVVLPGVTQACDPVAVELQCGGVPVQLRDCEVSLCPAVAAPDLLPIARPDGRLILLYFDHQQLVRRAEHGHGDAFDRLTHDIACGRRLAGQHEFGRDHEVVQHTEREAGDERTALRLKAVGRLVDRWQQAKAGGQDLGKLVQLAVEVPREFVFDGAVVVEQFAPAGVGLRQVDFGRRRVKQM